MCNQPELNPRYGHVHTTPPTWATFGNRSEFATLRSLEINANNTVVNYAADITQYAVEGDVIWPVYQTVFVDNWVEVLEYFKANNKYMTDLWGFVPGAPWKRLCVSTRHLACRIVAEYWV